jgi:hypothetical protein
MVNSSHDSELPESNQQDRPLVIRALDFFVGGVPPFGYFVLEVNGLKKLVAKSRAVRGLNQTAEVCLIALSAYFEAFCKAQFAGIINVCPRILRSFVAKRDGAKLDLYNVVEVLGHIENKLGNLMSEDFDFGSAKSVNSLYYDLLGITPFSSDDKKKYMKFLSDRNLLVHHGGVYTFAYTAQRFTRRTAPGLPHWSSLVVSKHDHNRWANFLLAIAKKIASTSKAALKDYVRAEGIVLHPEQTKAIEFLSDIP